MCLHRSKGELSDMAAAYRVWTAMKLDMRATKKKE
jgi:hypothetical protein